MSTKLSALTTISAAASYVYGIDSTPTSYKIPVNAAWGVPQLDASTNLNPVTDDSNSLGGPTLRWAQLFLSDDAALWFSDGVTNNNGVTWNPAVGPIFKANLSGALAFDISGLNATRTATWPNASGTVTLLGNSSTGSGLVVLATGPTLSSPIVGTQAIGDNSTKAASTAFVGAQHSPAWLSARRYSGLIPGTANSTLVQNTLYAVPIWIPPGTSPTVLAVNVTAAVASTTIRMGIYADGGGKPTTLIVDGGTVSSASTGERTVTIAPGALNGGWYWLAVAWQGGASSPTLQLANGCANSIVGTTNVGSLPLPSGYAQTSISGALPTPWGATLTETNLCPVVWAGP